MIRMKKGAEMGPTIVIGDQNSFSVFVFQWTYLKLILNKVKPSDKVLIDMLANVMWLPCFQSKSNAKCELFRIEWFQIYDKIYNMVNKKNTSPVGRALPTRLSPREPPSLLGPLPMGTCQPTPHPDFFSFLNLILECVLFVSKPRIMLAFLVWQNLQFGPVNCEAVK